MARSRAHRDTRAGKGDVNGSSQGGKRIRTPTKRAEGMIDTDEAFGYGKKGEKAGNGNPQKKIASSKVQPAKPHGKATPKRAKKEKEDAPEVMFPGLQRYAAEKQATEAQDSGDESDDSDEGPSQEEINREVTKRSELMSDQIAALLKLIQEGWMQSQSVAENFLDYVAYVGDRGDRVAAELKFDRVRKRRIRGEKVQWPAAKRVREEDTEE